MEKVAVVGAGLVGSLQALLLAQKGYEVDVYERRPDLRKAEFAGGRSINLALSDRGWKALDRAGLSEKIKSIAIPMYARKMHAVDGELTDQPYGLEDQAIYSVSRGGLNQELLLAADQHENVNLYFHHKCLDVDLENTSLEFQDEETGVYVKANYDRIFATDGAFSAVRMRMQKTDRFNYSQEYLTHGYKELVIPANEDGTHRIDKNCLHIWPRGEFMLIALPNLDGSFTVTLFFPFEGETSFESIQTDQDIIDFFGDYFPDALDHMPTIIDDYYENPTSSLVTVRCNPWHYKDNVILMGDAAHAVVPFYGQGMNAGFEDCSVFWELFEKYAGEWDHICKEYTELRVPDGNAIADLALRNYIEMRDLTGDPKFLLQKKIEKKIQQKHPDKWTPLYSQVTFSPNIRYSEALYKGQQQDQIMAKIMQKPNIEEIWDSAEIEEEILNAL